MTVGDGREVGDRLGLGDGVSDGLGLGETVDDGLGLGDGVSDGLGLGVVWATAETGRLMKVNVICCPDVKVNRAVLGWSSWAP